MSEEIYGRYEYPQTYYVYNFIITNGNKKTIDKNPIDKIHAAVKSGFRRKKLVYNGIITNSKIMEAEIETPRYIDLKPDMYLKDRRGKTFKVIESTFEPDIDKEEIGSKRIGITRITITSAE